MMPRLSDLPPPEPIRAGGEALLVRRLGAGPRLVLLHGGPGLDHHLLVPVALPLAARNEVWLVDLPGHGRAGGPPVGLKATLERLARFLCDVDAEIVGGHSLGAWLVRELLRNRAIGAQAAVWIAPPGPHRARAAPCPDDETALREALHADVGAGGPIDPLVREALEATVVRSPAHHARLVGDLLPLLRAAVPSCDPRCPVLVVGGGRDPVAPPHVARAVAAATRGAELELLPDAAHYPWASGAAHLAARIRRFLDRDRAQARSSVR